MSVFLEIDCIIGNFGGNIFVNKGTFEGNVNILKTLRINFKNSKNLVVLNFGVWKTVNNRILVSRKVTDLVRIREVLNGIIRVLLWKVIKDIGLSKILGWNLVLFLKKINFKVVGILAFWNFRLGGLFKIRGNCTFRVFKGDILNWIVVLTSLLLFGRSIILKTFLRLELIIISLVGVLNGGVSKPIKLVVRLWILGKIFRKKGVVKVSFIENIKGIRIFRPAFWKLLGFLSFWRGILQVIIMSRTGGLKVQILILVLFGVLIGSTLISVTLTWTRNFRVVGVILKGTKIVLRIFRVFYFFPGVILKKIFLNINLVGEGNLIWGGIIVVTGKINTLLTSTFTWITSFLRNFLFTWTAGARFLPYMVFLNVGGLVKIKKIIWATFLLSVVWIVVVNFKIKKELIGKLVDFFNMVVCYKNICIQENLELFKIVYFLDVW